MIHFKENLFCQGSRGVQNFPGVNFFRISRKTYCFAFKRTLVSSNFHSLVIFTHHRGCYKYIFCLRK